jgi:hypothetical protein
VAIEALVASAITVLSPYVVAGATKAAEVVGEAVATRAGKLLGKIRDWFSGDSEATAALGNFETNPSRYGAIVQDILREKAGADPKILNELEQLLGAMGPRVEVFQKVRTLAGQAVGLDLAKWEKGLAAATQDVDVVERGATLIGAKIGS